MTTPLRSMLDSLLDGTDLSEPDAEALLVALTDATMPPAMAGAMLAALRSKGVAPAELRGFARAMRGLARRPQLPAVGPIVDVVGTGGDGSHSFNLSTGTALLSAACGVRIAKHGNRSVSSRSGSADLLEALGLVLPLDEIRAGQCLERTGFTFLFAPHYHPAMKAVAPVRAALGVRTVFNMLGPLTNPAAPPYQLIGAYSLEAARLIAEALAGLPIERAYVLHGSPGWDEPTPAGPFTLIEVADGTTSESVRSAADYGLPSCSPEELRGGDAAHNAEQLKAVFAGRDRGAHRHALILGAALVLQLTGRATDPHAAAAQAGETLDSGAAEKLLASLAAFAKSP